MPLLKLATGKRYIPVPRQHMPTVPVCVFLGEYSYCGRVDVSFAPFELRSHTSALKLALMSVFEYRKSVLSVLKVSRLVSFVPTTPARLLTRPISI